MVLHEDSLKSLLVASVACASRCWLKCCNNGRRVENHDRKISKNKGSKVGGRGRKIWCVINLIETRNGSLEDPGGDFEE